MWAGGYSSRMDQVGRKENSEKDDWKVGSFEGDAKTWCKGNFQKSTRMTPTKTPLIKDMQPEPDMHLL